MTKLLSPKNKSVRSDASPSGQGDPSCQDGRELDNPASGAFLTMSSEIASKSSDIEATSPDKVPRTEERVPVGYERAARSPDKVPRSDDRVPVGPERAARSPVLRPEMFDEPELPGLDAVYINRSISTAFSISILAFKMPATWPKWLRES